MKYSKPILSLLFLASSALSGRAAAFYDSFSYPVNSEMHGQGGWSIDAANLPTVGSLPAQLGTVVNIGGDTWGSLGGQWSYPNTTSVELTHSAALPLLGTQFKVDVDIVGSVGTGTELNRDKFGWSLKNGSSSDLMRLAFEPGQPGLMEVVWYDNNGATRHSTGVDVAYNAIYSVSLSFGSTSGSDMIFYGSITGTNTVPFSGALTGLASANIASVNADFDVTAGTAAAAGTNYMAFNNLAVPEPSSMLTGALALFGLAARRRR